MNYLDGKHYILSLILYKGDHTEDIIEHYIISDKNPLKSKEIINKYIPEWKEEFFYEFGGTDEDKPHADTYAEEYGIFEKEFDDIYNIWEQNYLDNIDIKCILITEIQKTEIEWFNKQNWIKI